MKLVFNRRMLRRVWRRIGSCFLCRTILLIVDCPRAILMSSKKLCGDRLSSIIARITIEPIVFFNYLALSFFHVSQHSVLYRSICIQNYGQYDMRIDCVDLSKNGPDVEDDVQRAASMWTMILSLCYLLPAVISDAVLGAWSDRYGRKVNILIGLTGLIVASVASIGLAVYPLMPLYVLCVAKVFAGLCGYVAIVMISSWAYLSDIVENKKELTSRMMSVQVYRFVADVLGSFSFSSISRWTSLAITLLLAECFFAVAFFYALARLYQAPPAVLKRISRAAAEKRRNQRLVNGSTVKYGTQQQHDGVQIATDPTAIDTGSMETQRSDAGDRRMIMLTDPDEKSGLPPPPAPPVDQIQDDLIDISESSPQGTCYYVWLLYRGVWETLTKPRPRNERAHILFCSLIYFVFMMSEIGLQGSIFSLYVFHRPFFWTPSALGRFKGFQHGCALIVNLFGAFLLNGLVDVEDTSIMLLGLASGIVHLTVTGLADDSWTLYAAAASASFGSLLVPALKSFMVRTVSDDEVGKALAVNGIAADLAFVASALVFTNLYTFTVSTHAGTVFFLGAGLLVLCFVATIWIKVDRKRQSEVNRTIE